VQRSGRARISDLTPNLLMVSGHTTFATAATEDELPVLEAGAGAKKVILHLR